MINLTQSVGRNSHPAHWSAIFMPCSLVRHFPGLLFSVHPRICHCEAAVGVVVSLQHALRPTVHIFNIYYSNIALTVRFHYCCCYRAMHVVQARYCYRMSSVRPSVRLSVCPSVTLTYRGHIGSTSSKIITRIISLGSSLLGPTTSAI